MRQVGFNVMPLALGGFVLDSSTQVPWSGWLPIYRCACIRSAAWGNCHAVCRQMHCWHGTSASVAFAGCQEPGANLMYC